MSRVADPPTLMCLIGPPAVGKTTVGRALCERTGFKLFHGHIVADALSPFFPFGTPHFQRLSQSWRRTFLEAAADAGLNVVTTVAWRFDVPEDGATIRSWLQPYIGAGRVLCVELRAPLQVLLERNRSPERRQQKNPYWVTDAYLEEGVAAHSYRSSSAFPFDVPHLAIETESLSAGAAASRIIDHFGLIVTEAFDPTD